MKMFKKERVNKNRGRAWDIIEFTLETYIILLTNVTPINLILKNKKEKMTEEEQSHFQVFKYSILKPHDTLCIEY